MKPEELMRRVLNMVDYEDVYPPSFLDLREILSVHTDAMAWIDTKDDREEKLRRLADCVEVAANWLTALGVADWRAVVLAEWEHAHGKHPTMTLDQEAPTTGQRIACITEEVGEVARALTYDREHAGELVEEVTQWGALCAAEATRPLRAILMP